MTLTVHHLNNSRSQRVLWLLEELGVPYELKIYQRLPSRRAPPELRKIHPLGKSPVITDGDLTLAESGAIVEYIIRTYGQGRAQPAEQYWTQDAQWAHAAEGTIMPMMVNKLIFSLVPAQAPFLIRPLISSVFGALTKQLVDPEIQANIDYASKCLQQTTDASKVNWFAGGDKDGNPTAADYQMLFPLEAAASGRAVNCPQNLKEWVDKVHQRPAYKIALEKGGPYAYA